MNFAQKGVYIVVNAHKGGSIQSERSAERSRSKSGLYLISWRSIAAKVLPSLLRERGTRWRLTMARAASVETLRRSAI